MMRFFLLFPLSFLPVLADLSAETIPGSTKVDAIEVAELMKMYVTRRGGKVRRVLFVDTRKRKDLEQGGTIPGAVHLDIKKPSEGFSLENILGHPRFTGDVLVFCNGHSCLRAQKATQKLLAWKSSGEDGGRLGAIYYFRDGFPGYRDHVYEDGATNAIVRPY